MRVLSISLDPTLSLRTSAASKRMITYGNDLLQLTIFAFGKESGTWPLSEQTHVHIISNRFGKVAGIFRMYREILRHLSQKTYDLVTVQDTYFLAMMVYIVAKKKNMAFHVQVHGFEKPTKIRKAVARYVLPRAHGIRTVSARLEREIDQDFSVDEARISIVPMYATPETSPVAHEYASEAIQLLTVSRLVPIKDIDMQLRALYEVRGVYPYVHLTIIGDGPERARLEKLCKELQLMDAVNFSGWQEDIEHWYRSGDIFLLTSQKEGWPRVIVEAATYGLPIICTKTGSVGDFLKEGENAMIVPIGDEEELIASLLKLIPNKKERTRLGSAAQQSAFTLPSEKELRDRFLASFRDTVAYFRSTL